MTETNQSLKRGPVVIPVVSNPFTWVSTKPRKATFQKPTNKQAVEKAFDEITNTYTSALVGAHGHKSKKISDIPVATTSSSAAALFKAAFAFTVKFQEEAVTVFNNYVKKDPSTPPKNTTISVSLVSTAFRNLPIELMDYSAFLISLKIDESASTFSAFDTAMWSTLIAFDNKVRPAVKDSRAEPVPDPVKKPSFLWKKEFLQYRSGAVLGGDVGPIIAKLAASKVKPDELADSMSAVCDAIDNKLVDFDALTHIKRYRPCMLQLIIHMDSFEMATTVLNLENRLFHSLVFKHGAGNNTLHAIISSLYNQKKNISLGCHILHFIVHRVAGVTSDQSPATWIKSLMDDSELLDHEEDGSDKSSSFDDALHILGVHWMTTELEKYQSDSDVPRALVYVMSAAMHVAFKKDAANEFWTRLWKFKPNVENYAAFFLEVGVPSLTVARKETETKARKGNPKTRVVESSTPLSTSEEAVALSPNYPNPDLLAVPAKKTPTPKNALKPKPPKKGVVAVIKPKAQSLASKMASLGPGVATRRSIKRVGGNLVSGGRQEGKAVFGFCGQ
ncbi:hypothetical protein HDU79_000763 [Rhizoclosmatium sp. JEL0117]|nr:hypothetical protein HDU79_000763 [Rhizoclosmatium sp. JEL0117]